MMKKKLLGPTYFDSFQIGKKWEGKVEKIIKFINLSFTYLFSISNLKLLSANNNLVVIDF